MIPRRVRLAVLLAFCLHGVLTLAGRYRFSYDAYTHMLFADHYRNSWWSLWDTRWYAGFSVSSYPPLVHQVIGLISHITGVDAAFAIVLWAILSTFPLAVYAFSRIFIEQSQAEYSALGASFLPSVYLSAYTFGQLPTLASTLLALFCTASLAEFLKSGKRLSGALAVLLVATIMGAHHATLLFLPWLFLAVGLYLLLNRQVDWKKLTLRLVFFGLPAAFVAVVVIWPFWRWGLHQAMQTPIDHVTRHNYFKDMRASFLFFWSEYGPLVVLIPFALWKFLDKRFLSLAAAFGGLLMLGLGGTTPLPHWLFGSGWEWLIYDRFAFWASLFLLVFFGIAVALMRRKRQLTAIFTLLAGTSLLVSFYPTLLPMQPKPVNMQPIVDYLAKDDRSQWRYLTFGFGDQFAYLNRLTTATTIDGSYHTARTIPELRSSGIGSIDSVFWHSNDLTILDPILKMAGDYGVRWGFVEEKRYNPALIRNGWVKRDTLSNGIQVWENPKAVIPPLTAKPETEPFESFSWGTLPLLALAVTAALAGLRLSAEFSRRFLDKVYTLAVSLLPIGAMFWYFRPLTDVTYGRVYFSYNNALFYLTDALAVVAMLAWAVVRWFDPYTSIKNKRKEEIVPIPRIFHSASPWLIAICSLASLSVLWSKDWRISFYISLHLWLGFGLFLSLRDRPQAWRFIAYGFTAALAMQMLFGFFEFAKQSTSFLQTLKLIWPGLLTSSTPAASVVQLVDGRRWLRAYGTLPHPNILGTFTVALLAGPATLFLTGKKLRLWALLLFSGGVALLVIIFSRGAWVGFIASGLYILFKTSVMNRRRIAALGILTAITLIAVILPLYPLVSTRVSAPSSIPTEDFSIKGRTWLADQALGVIQRHTLLGIGIGTFVIDLAQRASVGYIIEPAHNLFLLAFSELGIGGALALFGLSLVTLRIAWKVSTPESVLLSAGVIGLGAASLFDHSLWTLAPSRIFLALNLGLWAGQVEYAAS